MKNPNGILKPIISILVSMVLIISFTPPVFAAGEGYAISSETNTPLYNALHAAPYNLDPTNTKGITAAELAGLDGTLDLTGKSILSIEGLQNCSGIETLILAQNYITDVSVLSGKTFTSINLQYNYLDPTAGSADRTVLDALAGVTASSYENQYKSTVNFTHEHGNSTVESAADVYYGQSIQLPVLTGYTPDYMLLGWDTDGDGTVETAAADTSVAFTWPTLPVPGDTAAYTAVFRTAYTDCTLTALGCSQALSPAFSSATTAYKVNLPLSTTKTVVITPTAVANATFTIDGESVASKTYTLAFGQTKTAKIVVTAENSTHTMTYTVTMKRAAADASRLLDPGISAGKLNAAFSPSRLSYTLTLPEGTASVKFTPVKCSSAAKLYINGKKRASYTLTLKNGQSKTVKIQVVSPSRVKRTYTFKVVRAKSTNAYLSSIKLSPSMAMTPKLNKSATAYSVTVPESKSSVTITVACADKNATVTIDGKRVKSKKVKIDYGSTKSVTVKVKAQAGNTRTYTITLRRPPHIKSFSATPIEDGKPTLTLSFLTGKSLVFAYTIAPNAGSETTTKLEIYSEDGKTLKKTLVSRSDKAGSYTYTWAGYSIGGSGGFDYTSTGTYKAKLSLSYTHGGVTLNAAPKWLTFVVK